MSKLAVYPALPSLIDISPDLRILCDMPVVLCTGVERGLLFTRKVMLERAGYTVFLATTQSALIQACRQHRVNVAVIGHEHDADTKRQFFALVRRYCPSAKILEAYPVELGRTLKAADAWIALPKQEPLELVECVEALMKKRAPTLRRERASPRVRHPATK